MLSNGPKDVHTQMLGTWECITLHGKREFAGMIGKGKEAEPANKEHSLGDSESDTLQTSDLQDWEIINPCYFYPLFVVNPEKELGKKNSDKHKNWGCRDRRTLPVLPVSGRTGWPAWKAVLQNLVQVRTHASPQDSATSLPNRCSREMPTQGQGGHAHGNMPWGTVCGNGKSGCPAQEMWCGPQHNSRRPLDLVHPWQHEQTLKSECRRVKEKEAYSTTRLM